MSTAVLSSAQQAVQQLRSDVESIASTLATVLPPAAPLRVTEKGYRIWREDEVLVVLTAEGGVFIAAGQKVPYRSATSLEWWPDWAGLSPSEARTIAAALLAAAADVAGGDPR